MALAIVLRDVKHQLSTVAADTSMGYLVSSVLGARLFLQKTPRYGNRSTLEPRVLDINPKASFKSASE